MPGAEEGAALGPVDAQHRRVVEVEPAPDAGEESAGVIVREDDARPGGDERIGGQEAGVERSFVEAVELRQRGRRLDLDDAPALRVYGPERGAFLGTGRVVGGELIASRLLSPLEVGDLVAAQRQPSSVSESLSA